MQKKIQKIEIKHSGCLYVTIEDLEDKTTQTVGFSFLFDWRVKDATGTLLTGNHNDPDEIDDPIFRLAGEKIKNIRFDKYDFKIETANGFCIESFCVMDFTTGYAFLYEEDRSALAVYHADMVQSCGGIDGMIMQKKIQRIKIDDSDCLDVTIEDLEGKTNQTFEFRIPYGWRLKDATGTLLMSDPNDPVEPVFRLTGEKISSIRFDKYDCKIETANGFCIESFCVSNWAVDYGFLSEKDLNTLGAQRCLSPKFVR